MVSKKFCDFCSSEIKESDYELEVVRFGTNLDICNLCLGKISEFLDNLKK